MASLGLTNASAHSRSPRSSTGASLYPDGADHAQAGPIRKLVVTTVRAQPKTTVVYDTLWRLAAERQEIYFRRLFGVAPPWTDDPVLQSHRFTNAYRAADRTTQVLIREVLYAGTQTADEVFLRAILFRIFNRIETWRHLLSTAWPKLFGFRTEPYISALDDLSSRNEPIYSAAYIIPPWSREVPKYLGHLHALESIIKRETAKRAAQAGSLADLYNVLLEVNGLGPFLAYQLAIDLTYSTEFDHDEREFVVAGPGAHEGIAKAFDHRDGWTDAELIRWTTERQASEFSRLGIEFIDLWGRELTLIDVQNLFCETAKYSRIAHPEFTRSGGRSHLKRRFSPMPSVERPWFPPKWGINPQIAIDSRLDLR
jgi:hypothetical protein